jgi:Plavaka transposase
MERRPWARRVDRQLPVRFRDCLPQPPPALPPPNIAQPTNIHPPSLPYTQDRLPLRHIFTSHTNIFGLSRRYETTELPSHDPDEHLSLQQLSNIPAFSISSSSGHQLFHPYPNYSSFLLGDWFWNGGEKKSIGSFKDLINIVSDPEFRQADIQNIHWDRINDDLAANEVDDWLDEDAGWSRTPVSISVPYQRRRGIPSDFQAGPRNYVVGEFYHRSLVSIIREKISALSDSNLFHFEPYEFLWQRPMDQDPIRVQGELYTSPAFIDAHRELQNSPGEPGCNLPRVIISLMFWSDATQLTAFGSAQLWPLYLFFGNDSKYLRSKPSCHLCEHVAYFQKVGALISMPLYSPILNFKCNSSLACSKISLPHRPQEANVQAERS